MFCFQNIDVRTESKIATRPSGEPEQAYHVKCFHCANCRSFLAGVPFYETSDGVLMCKQCTSQTEPRRCSKCKTTVYGKEVPHFHIFRPSSPTNISPPFKKRSLFLHSNRLPKTFKIADVAKKTLNTNIKVD